MERDRSQATCPLTYREVVDLYFIEHRAKVLDVAAFFDRLDRARSDARREEDRHALVEALIEAVGILIDGRGDRARRVLEILSDPTTEPLLSAAGLKGAYGAFPGHREVRKVVSA